MSCSEPASGASARYQRGRPRTRTHKALTTLAAFSLRDTSASHGCSARFTRFTSDDHHPIPSCARRAGPGGGRGSTTPDTVATGGRQPARHQKFKTNLGVEELVSNVTCVECAPPRGVELSFREILIFRLRRVCAAVVAVSDLCRIYRQERATASTVVYKGSCRVDLYVEGSPDLPHPRGLSGSVPPSAIRVRHGSIAAPAGGCWVQASRHAYRGRELEHR